MQSMKTIVDQLCKNKVKDKTGIKLDWNCNSWIMKKILIAGGYSKEREISLLTAKSVIQIKKKNIKFWLKNQMEILLNNWENLNLQLLHGRYGEDGYTSILEVKKLNILIQSSIFVRSKELSKIFIKNRILRHILNMFLKN